MKKLFMTGLILLLPLVMTLVIVSFIINIFTKPFTGFVQEILEHYGILDHFFWIFNNPQALAFMSKMIVFLGIIILTFLVGFVAQMFLVRFFLRTGDRIIHKIPLINKIYKIIQDTMNTVFGEKNKTKFSQVVLVPFPHKKNYSLGLVATPPHPNSTPEYQDLVSVFVPGSPNPSMGFMLLYPKNQLIPLDVKVEEAFKCLVSCGVMLPNLKKDFKSYL
jgi:uncharacterized membrane protein